jgi:hypothetical protein
MCDRGVARGELDPKVDPEVALDLIFAPAVYRMATGRAVGVFCQMAVVAIETFHYTTDGRPRICGATVLPGGLVTAGSRFRRN